MAKNKTRKEIFTKNCEIDDFFNHFDNTTFNNIKISEYTCAKVNKSIEIEGTYIDAKFQYVELGILIKDTIFASGDLSNIKKYFDSNALRLVLYWIDSTIEVNSITNPVSNYVRTYVVYLDYYTIKKINLDFSTIQFSSDNNLFYKDPNTIYDVEYKDAEHQELFCNNRTSLASTIGKTLTKMFIRSSPSGVLIDRTYQKLSTFLANYAGLMSNILLGLFIFVSFFNQFWAEQEVMNNALKFREHYKVRFSKELNEIKNNFKKDILIIDSSIPNVNDEYVNQEKIFDKLNNIIMINENNLNNNDESNRQIYSSVSINKNQMIELNDNSLKDNTTKNFQDKSESALKKDIQTVLNDEIPKNINLSASNSSQINKKNKQICFENQKINFNKRSNSLHHVKLRERGKKIDFTLNVEELFSNSNKALGFNCFGILCRNCSSKSRDLKFFNSLYTKGIKKIQYYFDVNTYIKKIQEIDIMKYLLLDKNQLMIFNFLSKPSVSNLYSDSDDIYQNIEKNREFHDDVKMKELSEIMKNYDSMKAKTDDIYNKLFYLFDYELDNLLIG